MNSDLIAFVSQNVVLPGHDEPQPATVKVDRSTGKIIDIVLDQIDLPNNSSIECVDVGSKYILPGLVDAHVHLNEPGRTDWEGFWTGTRAAAAGGVCTLVDMPLNSIPPTTTVNNLHVKMCAGQGQCWIDVAFWGGVIPGNKTDLKPLVAAGVKGFKCFLIDSGVQDFPCVSEKDVLEAMQELSDENRPTALLFHAELDTAPSTHTLELSDHECTLYSTFLSSRPPKLETDAASLVVSLQRRFPSVRCHIVHLSAAPALPLLHAARSEGLPLTAETCFHYLCLAAEDIPDACPAFKCCPPIRARENAERLWAALADGLLDCVVSDHSPCVPELKLLDEGDVMHAWGGISTLGLGLSLLWTEGCKRGVSIGQIVDWTSRNSAKHAGLGDVKGQLAVGYDADLVVWNPEAEFQVTRESLRFKNKVSPYEGLTLRGVVEKTFLRGQLVYDNDLGHVGSEAVGKFL